MNGLIAGLAGQAVTAATDAADAKASALYEKNKPLIYAAAFMAVTVYIFYFLPRFTAPGR